MTSDWLLKMWTLCNRLPKGYWLFSRLITLFVPYSGTVGATILTLEPGHARIRLKDRWRVRNHLKSIHAVALMNIAEMSTGLATMAALPPSGRVILKHFEIEYIKKCRGTIYAEARTDRIHSLEKQDRIVESFVRDSNGELLCKARVTWQIGSATGPK